MPSGVRVRAREGQRLRFNEQIKRETEDGLGSWNQCSQPSSSSFCSLFFNLFFPFPFPSPCCCFECLSSIYFFSFVLLSVCLRCLSRLPFPPLSVSLPFPCSSLIPILLYPCSFSVHLCLDLEGGRRGTVINLISLFRSGPRLFVSSIFSFSVGRREDERRSGWAGI